MGCETIKLGNGIAMIACSRGGRVPKCHYCSRPSSKLCDFPVPLNEPSPSNPAVPNTKLCSRRLCGQCARSVAADVDHCRIHAREAAR